MSPEGATGASVEQLRIVATGLVVLLWLLGLYIYRLAGIAAFGCLECPHCQDRADKEEEERVERWEASLRSLGYSEEKIRKALDERRKKVPPRKKGPPRR